MIDTKLKFGALAAACCFVLILVPVLANAQVGGVIHKGAQGVQKGVDTGVDKTKEGAQATKNAITGKDQNADQNRMKPQESQQNPSATESQPSETRQKNMPRTAGELPMLALAGCLALSAAGLSRAIRRQKNH